VRKIGEHTIRGRLESEDGVELVDGASVRIRLFSGDFRKAYRVTKFLVISGDQSNTDGMGRLTTEQDVDSGSFQYVNMADQRQIAWATINGTADINMVDMVGLVARDNLVVEDLYMTFRGPSGVESMNYYIECDVMELDEMQGPLVMVQNRSQG